MGIEYRAEVPLKLEVPQEQYVLALEGRADGIITSEEGVTIDEIKCMYTDVTRFGGTDFCAQGAGDVLRLYLCVAEWFGSDFRADDVL